MLIQKVLACLCAPLRLGFGWLVVVGEAQLEVVPLDHLEAMVVAVGNWELLVAAEAVATQAVLVRCSGFVRDQLCAVSEYSMFVSAGVMRSFSAYYLPCPSLLLWEQFLVLGMAVVLAAFAVSEPNQSWECQHENGFTHNINT